MASTRLASASSSRRSIAGAPSRVHFLGQLGERGGQGVGALARLARGDADVVAAAAEDRDGLGHRLDLALEDGDAVGERGIGRARARIGERGLEPGQPAGKIVDGARDRPSGGARTRGDLAQLLLEAGEPRFERGGAEIAGGEVGAEQCDQHRGEAGHAGADQPPGGGCLARFGAAGGIGGGGGTAAARAAAPARPPAARLARPGARRRRRCRRSRRLRALARLALDLGGLELDHRRRPAARLAGRGRRRAGSRFWSSGIPVPRRFAGWPSILAHSTGARAAANWPLVEGQDEGRRSSSAASSGRGAT